MAGGGAALICFRLRDGSGSSQTSEITYWLDFSEALEADATFPDCGRGCGQFHAVVHRDTRGRLRTIQVRRPPDVDDVRSQLREALDGDGQALARLRDNLDTNHERREQQP
jgi:hypothetical protein